MPANTVTHESIRELMDTPGPCLTLVSKPGNELSRILGKLENEDAAAEITAAVAGLPSTPERSGQVAIFRSSSALLVSHVGADVKPIVKTADAFDLRTLLSVAAAQKRFYILALSQKRTRLLACTQDHSEEVALSKDTPISLEDSRQTRKPDHVLDNMAVGGPSTGSMKGVMSGTSTDREDKDEFILHFFKEVDRGVNAVLKGSSDPLVVVGVEREIAIYKRVNSYSMLVEPGVHGAPDGLEGGEMHKRALELLSKTPVDSLSDFDKKVGTGHASVHIQDIAAAAFEGRVSHLYFQSDAHYTGSYDSVRQRVKHDGEEDLIEAAAAQTLSHGGDVRVLSGSSMPNGVPVCALFRYPAAQFEAA